MAANSEETMIQRSAAIAMLVRVSAAGLAYVLQAFLAQVLGAYEYGLYAYAWIWILIGGRWGAFGFGQASTRFISEYRDGREFELARGFMASSQIFVLIGSTLVALLGLAGLYAFGDLVSTPYIMPLYLAMFCVPLIAFQNLMEGHALAWSWTGLAFASSYLVRQGLIILLVGAAILTGLPPTAEFAMVAVIVAVLASTILQSLLLRRQMRKSIPDGTRKFKLSNWITTAFPLFLIDSFQLVLTFCDILILGFYVEPAMVAIYYAVTRINQLIGLVGFAISSAVGQRFAGITARQGRLHVAPLVRKALQWTFWPSFVVALGIVACGWLLLRMFGAEFTQAYPLLPILAVGMVIRASVGTAEDLLIMLGHEKATFAAQAIGTVASVLLNLILIPVFGIYGAAIATTLSIALYSAALEVCARKLVGISSWIVTAGRAVGGTESPARKDIA